jgi:branched-chain amino acid transport system ATP-binding protein
LDLDVENMESPILSVEGVTKSFGGLIAVNNLTFDVREGEVLGLMGPNGAGKTTVFNLISGVYKPASGTIRFRGREINSLPPHIISRLGISRTYQIPQPFTTLTVSQNLLVAAQSGGHLERAAAESEAHKVLEIAELSDRKDVPARDLGLLDLKRLELARALSGKPTLLLIDEVAAGLTEVEIPRLLEILKTIRKMGITIILIEHVMTVMVRAVDRLIVLNQGEKLAEGKPDEIMKNLKVIEAYLGEA